MFPIVDVDGRWNNGGVIPAGRAAFHARLRQAFMASGAKRAHFAALLGISRQKLQGYLNEDRYPLPKTALQIAEHLGWPVEEVRGWYGLSLPGQRLDMDEVGKKRAKGAGQASDESGITLTEPVLPARNSVVLNHPSPAEVPRSAMSFAFQSTDARVRLASQLAGYSEDVIAPLEDRIHDFIEDAVRAARSKGRLGGARRKRKTG